MTDDLRNLIYRLEERFRELESLISKIERDIDKRHSENVAMLTTLVEATKHLDECLDDTKKELFGNGQPGALSVLETRISAVEKWMWRGVGIMWALGLIFEAIYTLFKE